MATINRSVARCQQLGHSLLEALVCGALLAVLLALVVPALSQFVLRQRLQGVAQAVMADLQQARAEAVRSGESVQFNISQPAGGSCYIVHTGPSGACRCMAGGRAVCEAGATPIKTQWLPQERTVAIRANVKNLSFHASQGTVTSTGSIELHLAGGATAVRHVVSIAGRVRSCAPSNAIGGLKPCQA